MKDIGFIMEQTTSKSMKYLLLTYVLEITLFGALVALDIKQDIYYMIVILTTLSLLYFAHQKRYKITLEEGAMNRILLLPVKRRAYMWSELLFTSATFCFYFLILYVLWFGLQYLKDPGMSIGYLMQLNYQHRSLLFIIPDGWFQLMLLSVYILLLTVQTVSLALAMVLKEKAGYVGGTIYLSWMVIIQGSSMNTGIQILFLVLVLVYIAICLFQINKMIGFKRKKVLS